jgi:guanine deaminase
MSALQRSRLRAPWAIRGKVLTPTTLAGGDSALRFLADGYVAFDAHGRVEAIAPYVEGAHDRLVRDVRPHVIVPGFVDTHTHIPQTRIIGSATGPLLDWLDQTVFPEEARFREANYAREVARDFIGRALAAGTTTTMAFSSSSPLATAIAFEELDRSGMRGVVGLTLMDQACPEVLRLAREPAIAACEELVERFHGLDGGRLGFAVTPRFALSCTRALMEAAGRFAQDHALIVQTHVAENAAEGQATLAMHPWATSYLDVYDRVGLLSNRTVLAHAIHLSFAEWDLLAERRGNVAHCPDSNFFLGSGHMPLGEPRSRGVAVALGSDVAAGRSFDMRRVMARAYDNALCVGASVTPEELFTMATQGGADVLGLGKTIGSLEVGKDADLVVIALPSYVDDRDQVLRHVVFGSDLAKPTHAFVRGLAVYPATSDPS